MRKIFTTSNEKGLTLIEVLASIVILSIIVIFVLLIFNQTMRTNKTSESIIDATYIAQKEMEQIYNISRQQKPQLSESNSYIWQQTNGDKWDIYKKELENSEFSIEVRKKDVDDMVRILVLVYDADNTLKAQMENLLQWGANYEATP